MRTSVPVPVPVPVPDRSPAAARIPTLVACLFALLFAFTPPAAAAPPPETTTLRGTVKTAGQRTPIAGASVLAWPADPNTKPGRIRDPKPPLQEPPWLRTTTTDDDGSFVIKDVPRGKTRVAVVAAGHERLEYVVDVGAAGTRVRLFPRPDEATAYRTVVKTTAEPRAQATSEQLTREEIATLPGNQGDSLRALQNLPGVARTPGGLGLLVLRGAAPGQSRVFMGGHALPRAFHFLSLASVFPADILDELELVPGNFDAAYGNASGGIVRIEPRRGRRDGFHGYGEIDLAAAGTMVEGPVGKGSFILGAQRGYVDAVLLATSRAIESVTGEDENFLLPSYWDYQGLFDYPVGKNASVGLRVFGAGDRLRGRDEEEVGPQGMPQARFDFRSQFHRIDLVFFARRRGWTFRLTPSFRLEWGSEDGGTFDLDRRRRDYVTSVRAEMQKRITRRFSLLVGADTEIDPFDVRTETPQSVMFPGQVPMTAVEETTELATATGLYATGDLRFGVFRLRPGVRASAFTLGSLHAFSADPRFVAHADPSDRWRVSLGVGRYSQAVSTQSRSDVDLVGNGTQAEGGVVRLPAIFSRLDPSIGFDTIETGQLPVIQAVHTSVGVRWRFAQNWSAALTGFMRDQHDGDPVTIGDQTLRSETRSRALGLEAIIRKRLAGRLYGWVAYTLMFAEVRAVDAPDDATRTRARSDFDQRHNLVFLLSYALPKNWRIGGRFRLVSGYPFTPVIGTIDLGQGLRQVVLGDTNTDQLPLFHQLDLRIDKRWILRRLRVTAYVDVQNVYNRQNPEAIVYSLDYRDRIGFVGAPIFPSFGLRLDY